MRVDDPSARDDIADRPGQMLGRGILEQEPGHVSGQRASKVTRAAEVGQDEGRAGRKLGVQLSGRRQPIETRQVDIDDRDIRMQS